MTDAVLLNKKQVQRMIIESIHKALKEKDSGGLPGRAKHIDYEISMLLAAADDKPEFCREILFQLEQLNKQKKKDVSLEDFFAKLKICLLGKLFYLSLKENKFLLIKDFIGRSNRQFVLKAVELIESSQENAVFFLDTVRDKNYRDFFNGIISCIYN
ncbi:MAG: hypothetical protein LBD99_00315 [Candidatus Margulisbacteria bacterium]|nr:hypothetical protein [Candidatus Margulisiibacteriota bacterium]